ncbi:MAG: hypothetical protein R3C71_13280 [Candidatus Krumholzibacteriia bacterium]|nr:hypothetical protein [bacterium]MCB9516467.1 hypothetical protein [Candidatus Latescibacterota bacterium]
MRLVKAIALLACALFATIPAAADTPYLGFDLLNAQGVNQYFTGFYVNQTLGSVFIVSGSSPLLVTHLGVFDMNPDNEPNWDPTNPPNSAYGFNTQHATALFKRSDMSKLGEVIIPAGTAAPIQDEGYRYMPLDEPVVLEPGQTYVIAAWFAPGTGEAGNIDSFYLMGTAPGDVPSTVTTHPDITILDGCFNPNAGDGSTCDAPFVFGMFWGLYAGGANFLVQETVVTEDTSWSRVKSLY